MKLPWNIDQVLTSLRIFKNWISTHAMMNRFKDLTTTTAMTFLLLVMCLMLSISEGNQQNLNGERGKGNRYVKFYFPWGHSHRVKAISLSHGFNIHWRIQGGARDARPPLGPNFFIFMQFLWIFGQNNRLVPPPLQLAPPPLRNPGPATDISHAQYTSRSDRTKCSQTKCCP